jgi:hypothetical protein
MCGHPGDVQTACAVLEVDQRVDPAQIHQVDLQKMAGEDAIGLRREELSPRGPASAGRRAYAGASLRHAGSHSGRQG